MQTVDRSTSLKILVIEPDVKHRAMLKEVLQQVGQSDIKLKNDARELFNIPRPVKFDMVFISVDPGYGLSGPDLIRFLTRTNLVTPWCKFVLTTEDNEYQLNSPIYRHLQTQIVYYPIKFDELKSLTEVGSIAINALKPVLSKLHKMSPAELVKEVTAIDLQFQDPIVNDELLSLKLKLLIQGKSPDLAKQVATTLNDKACRLRENLYISYHTGQEQDFNLCLEEAWNSGLYKAGSIYFRCNHLIFERKFPEALEQFNRLPYNEMQANEIEVLCLLKQKHLGVKNAFDFIDHEINRSDPESMSHHSLVITKLKMCYLAMITEEFDYFDPMELYLETQDLLENKGWTRDSFKYQTYKPFAQLGASLVAGKGNPEEIYNRLLKHIKMFDSSQLNTMLFAANCLKKDSDSLKIHEHLDRLLSRIEVSPELLTFRLAHAPVMESTMEAGKIKQRLFQLALNHWQAGRHYRALAKFREISINFETNSEFQTQYKRLIKEAGISSYWGFSAD